jgi:phosphatidylserine/phosphatidylglycerophosphate/cardiolipin synthase-like enzyme
MLGFSLYSCYDALHKQGEIMNWSLRHKFLVTFLPIATSIAAISILAPLLLERHSQEIVYQTTARAKLIGPNGRIKKALFSPEDNIRDVLLGLVSVETQRIMLASYVITDKVLVEELIKAHQRGVKVEIIVCRSGAQDQWSKVNMLIGARVPVYVYPSAFIRSLMHNKFVVFFKALDRQILATGSYNMTVAANKANQENCLFVDDPELVHQYIARFEALKRLSVFIPYGHPIALAPLAAGRASRKSFK